MASLQINLTRYALTSSSTLQHFWQLTTAKPRIRGYPLEIVKWRVSISIHKPQATLINDLSHLIIKLLKRLITRYKVHSNLSVVSMFTSGYSYDSRTTLALDFRLRSFAICEYRTYSQQQPSSTYHHEMYIKIILSLKGGMDIVHHGKKL